MLRKIKIGPRLVLLIGIQTVVLIIFGVTALLGLDFAANTSSVLNKNVIEQVKLNQLNEVVRSDLLETANKISSGKLGLESGRETLIAGRSLFSNNWNEYKQDRSKEDADEIQASLGDEYKSVITAFEKLDSLIANHEQQQLSSYIDKELPKLVSPFLTELNDRVNEQQMVSEELFSTAIEQSRTDLNRSIIAMLGGLGIASLLGYFIYRSIVKPIRLISTTVAKVSSGDYLVRTNMFGKDELSQLGSAFDNLLQDKVATLVQAQSENEKLNDSVIALLHAVSKLSQRDLTVKIPVTEDVTGPVADALNQLTSETSRVLQGVRRISEEVARASTLVKSQSDTVIKVAHDEQRDVLETINALSEAVDAMTHIAELAKSGNQAAENAIQSTHTALETVDGTVKSINHIRDTIHETEKRIKRLGERSQEISRAVNLINSISERTHILALNASMHAASAGEAGKGFAVVAEEVQRLAENARDATHQIATLVHNIQVETTDTVTTMNNVISQVVEGTRMAEQAGEQMRNTKLTTENLVSSVREIAQSSAKEAQRSSELRLRAQLIHESATKTSEQLDQQSVITTRLVEYAKGLLKAVQVFQLPGYSTEKKTKLMQNAEVLSSEFEQRKVS
ncbi:MAG: HAMP domain-containing protein [Gammaproteobacteria bacterium]|nr:HAMP domain-containing protein [Gammaproteobacteria bacterium]